MNDIFDYLDWRGDLNFAQSPLNEVDAACFAWLSYYEFAHLESIGISVEGRTLLDLAEQHARCFGEFESLNQQTMFLPDQAGAWTLHRMAGTVRFGGIKAVRFREITDEQTHTQFSAITFRSEHWDILAYRGTDMSVNGWREDCDLSFSEAVMSQRLAAAYLEEADIGRTLHLTGHSKGGNLAVYAAIHAPDSLSGWIADVWNFDGPGFLYGTVDRSLLARIRPKLHTFVPELSIVGMLLDHDEAYQVVRTSGNSILQHDVILWEVRGTRFLYADRRNLFSEVTDEAFREWIKGMTLDERREMVDMIFFVIESSGIRKFTDFSENGLRKGYRALQGMRNLSPEQRRMALRLFGELIRHGKQTVRNMFSKTVSLEEEH